MMPFLTRPEGPKKGSFWEKNDFGVGYVPVDMKDLSKGYIGSIRRIGKQYRWTAWPRVLKATTTAKKEPTGTGGLSKRLSSAVWSLRMAHESQSKSVAGGVDAD